MLWFGVVVGRIARLLIPGRQHLGLLATLMLGMVGSVTGGVAAKALGTGDLFELNFIGTVDAIVAAALLVLLTAKSSIVFARPS